ncbi:MAG: 4Fe-4S dicluster domain-containing protein [Deltaproteobacteria bacterium]|nr:4Fe-4S dicluster domain-containing protein [Deltaproteobacteria bacterium]
MGTATAAAAAASGCDTGLDLDSFFQKHYKEMTKEDKDKVFARIKKEQKEKYNLEVNVEDPPPMDGVRFAFAISLSACNGNRACVYACMKENNQGTDPPIAYIKVLEVDAGSMNPEHGDQYYDAEQVPRPGKMYLPVQCNQCDNPPCTKACPVEATWQEKDGIVVVDYDWCIGCRYCMAACPYEARHFNFRTPKLDPTKINTQQGYLSNRPRPKGVVEKCHFCLHRTRNGHYPACLEACPTGARKFGNILDENSEVSRILKEKRVFVLKEELNTLPHVFYFFD